uniref:Bis(5'-adenosyl)-triphosphatase n=1 Tax=Elaeophora elaphi TaxID=1147741 RepID=A0A0R3RNS6_9BILA
LNWTSVELIWRYDKFKYSGGYKVQITNEFLHLQGGVKRNETVTYDFVDQNYASIMVEDWIGAFSWPNCTGYGEPPTDHYSGALILRSTADISYDDAEIFNSHFYGGECQERYHKLIDYVDKFLDEYNGISKFVIIWLTMIAHDSASGLYRTDKYFADFFRRHISNLENSFVFVMADHGLRFGHIRETPIGEIEDNNPLLMASLHNCVSDKMTPTLPKYLRS